MAEKTNRLLHMIEEATRLKKARIHAEDVHVMEEWFAFGAARQFLPLNPHQVMGDHRPPVPLAFIMANFIPPSMWGK